MPERRHVDEKEHAPGTLYVISAASGAGKTSLVRALIESETGLMASVSHTTRPSRRGEQDGVHYHFVEEARFQAMLGDKAFLEHALVFDHYYGTSREWVMERLHGGIDVILEIDWQGARQIRASFAESIGIFILPPSRAALEERLRGRGQDSDVIIARRMGDAISEMSHLDEFDYLVINDDFDRALTDLQCIVQAGRLRYAAQVSRYRLLISSLLE